MLDDAHLQWMPSWLLQQLRRIRAAILHTLWPHDRSVWRCARLPTWWALQLLGVLPLVGPWWWLLLAFAVDKEDEFQLCQFIVALRCTHFVTLGVGAALYACVQSYRCAAFADGPTGCAARLPALSMAASAFWLVQLAIVTRAFLLLPHSKKKGQRVPVERRSRLTYEQRRALATGRSPLPDASEELTERGGVLLKLGSLDLGLAVLALLAVTIAALACHADPTLLSITLYHIRTCHGLLSCPYVLLRLPGANTLLTHARRTGYNRLGHCVPYAVTHDVSTVPSALASPLQPERPLAIRGHEQQAAPEPHALPDAPAAGPPAEPVPTGNAIGTLVTDLFSAGSSPTWPARRLRFPAVERLCDDGSTSGRVLRALSRQFGG